MKKTSALFLLLLFGSAIQAQVTYYLAANGNDNNSGTSVSAPWKTPQRINQHAQLIGFNPGDSVLFRSGDVFTGQINLQDNGSSVGTPIVFSSYGSGSQPVIAGDTTLAGSSFTVTGDTAHHTMPQPVKNLYINNRQAPIARLPNSGFYTIDANATANSCLDNQLPAGTYAGGSICIRTSNFTWEKVPVTGNTSVTINYTLQPTDFQPASGFGYFLQGKRAMMDTAFEWVQDNQLHIFVPPPYTVSALTIQAGIYDYGIYAANDRQFIHVHNLHFRGQTVNGIHLPGTNTQHNQVTSCTFSRQSEYGVYLQGSDNTISGCTFTDIHGKGLHGNICSNSTFSNNSFLRIGLYPGYGISGADGMAGISLFSSDNCLIDHNTLDSIGYCGIRADGTNNIVEKNILRNCMLRLSDAAAIYLYGENTQYVTIRNNFITASDGYFAATPATDFKTPAIYFDFWVNHCTADSNVIWQQAYNGLQLNPGTQDNTFRNNIVYGAANQGMIIIDNTSGIPQNPLHVINNRITRNTFYCLEPNTICLGQASNSQDWNTGVIDSNYYCNPYNTILCSRLNQQNFITTTYTLSGWNSFGFDTYTTPSFYQWSYPTNNSTLYSNSSDQPLVIPLPGNEMRDLDNLPVCGTLTLPPWSARILINTGAPCSLDIPDNTATADPELFPNPTNGQLQLRLPGEHTFIERIQLFDFTGKMVFETITDSGQQTANITMEHYPAGIYFIRVNNGTVKRVIRN